MKRIATLPVMIAAAALGYAAPFPTQAMVGTVCTHVDPTFTANGSAVSASLVFACPGTLGNKTIPQIYAAGYRVAQVLGPFAVASQVTGTSVSYRLRWDIVIEKP